MNRVGLQLALGVILRDPESGKVLFQSLDLGSEFDQLDLGVLFPKVELPEVLVFLVTVREAQLLVEHLLLFVLLDGPVVVEPKQESLAEKGLILVLPPLR